MAVRLFTTSVCKDQVSSAFAVFVLSVQGPILDGGKLVTPVGIVLSLAAFRVAARDCLAVRRTGVAR
jgi:hypothetical protein